MLYEVEYSFVYMGLKGKSFLVDWKQMLIYKEEVIGQNIGGVEFLMKKNKVDWFKGWVMIFVVGKVIVGDIIYEIKNIVIVLGFVLFFLSGVEVDNDKGFVVDSIGVLELGKILKKMVVIGVGVIGLELGLVYVCLGFEVIVVEYMDVVCSGMDKDVQCIFKWIFEKQGLNFVMGVVVFGVEIIKIKVKVNYVLKKKLDVSEIIDVDVVFVVMGCKFYVEGLGFDVLGVKFIECGQIVIDVNWVINVSGIYVIGDVIEGLMLVYKVEDEGMVVVDVIVGNYGYVNYGVIPGVVYMILEVVIVGQIEDVLKVVGYKIKVGKFLFMGNGCVKVVGQVDGFVKLIVDKEIDCVFGVVIIGLVVGDMIYEICVVMEFGVLV